MRADGPLLPPLDQPRGVAAEPLERLAPIRFGRETCGDLAAAERREWWVGNGLGGYAAGTVASTLTRRYHGLLIAPVDPPLGRALVFAKADAELIIGEERHPLFANRWASGAVAPQGHLTIESFHLDGSTPVRRFAIGACRISSASGWNPAPTPPTSPGACWRCQPVACRALRSRSSATAVTITARPGIPASRRKFPPKTKPSQ